MAKKCPEKCKIRARFKFPPAPEDNLTAVLYGIDDLRLEERPIPVPKDNEALLQIAAVGICGSDVHFLTEGRIGHFILTAPMVIGHEAAGTVIEVGKEVTNLKPGDRVAIEPGEPCRICTYCKEGRYNLCPDMKFCATPPYDGNLTRYFAHPTDFLFKLPTHVSFEEAVLLEPFAVGIHGCKRARVGIGSIVLILGAGPIGLTAAMAAKAFGASKVMITDLLQYRLDVAKTIGVDYTLLVDKDQSSDEVVKQILAVMGREPHVTMECSGNAQAVQTAIKVTRTGGVALLFGLGEPDVNIPLISALSREVDIMGVFRYVNDYQTALDMVSEGKVNLGLLVTHHFTIEDTLAAFEETKNRTGNPIKVIIHVNPDWAP